MRLRFEVILSMLQLHNRQVVNILVQQLKETFPQMGTCIIKIRVCHLEMKNVFKIVALPCSYPTIRHKILPTLNETTLLKCGSFYEEAKHGSSIALSELSAVSLEQKMLRLAQNRIYEIIQIDHALSDTNLEFSAILLIRHLLAHSQVL